MDIFQLVQKSALHDCELQRIEVDYVGAWVNLQLRSPQGQEKNLLVERFVSFEITHKEEWGKGKYVGFSDICFDSELGQYLLEIELNSGDYIKICFDLAHSKSAELE